jgi:hypothetical protein
MIVEPARMPGIDAAGTLLAERRQSAVAIEGTEAQ